MGGSRKLYQTAAVREAMRQIYIARVELKRKKFSNVPQYEDQSLEMFQIARHCDRENLDVVGEKYIHMDVYSLVCRDTYRITKHG